MPKRKEDTTKQEETSQQEDPQPTTAPLSGSFYYFANTGVGQPFAVEAKNEEEAKRLNQDYLDNATKETT